MRILRKIRYKIKTVLEYLYLSTSQKDVENAMSKFRERVHIEAFRRLPVIRPLFDHQIRIVAFNDLVIFIKNEIRPLNMIERTLQEDNTLK